MVQSRVGRLKNLTKNSNKKEKRQASHIVPPFGVPFQIPFWNIGFLPQMWNPSLENIRKSRPKTRKWGEIIIQSRVGRPQNLAKSSIPNIEGTSRPHCSPFWVTISDPFLEQEFFFCSEECSFLRGPVSGSVLGFVLALFCDRKVFEKKAAETREREDS